MKNVIFSFVLAIIILLLHIIFVYESTIVDNSESIEASLIIMGIFDFPLSVFMIFISLLFPNIQLNILQVLFFICGFVNYYILTFTILKYNIHKSIVFRISLYICFIVGLILSILDSLFNGFSNVGIEHLLLIVGGIFSGIWLGMGMAVCVRRFSKRRSDV